MQRLAALALASALAAAACGAQASPTPNLSAAVRYSFDFGGRAIQAADGRQILSAGGWTSSFDCGSGPDGRPDALRFDDSTPPAWDLARDGGTPPPLTRGGAGIVLRVKPDGSASFAVSLSLDGKAYTGTAPAESAALGFHAVAYATPPELLAVEGLRLTAADGSSIALTGTASFPDQCPRL